jgi:alpha-1,4-galacturonosyltransferase
MTLMVLQRLVRDFYKILNEVKTGEVPADLKLPDSFDKLISDMQTNQYDAKTFAFMLRGMVSCLLHLT